MSGNKTNFKIMKFVLSTIAWVESIAKKEIERVWWKIEEVTDRLVIFSWDAKLMVSVNLWSRVGNKLYILLEEKEKVIDFDNFFETIKNISFKIEKLNAKFINESEILQKEKIDLIVTEWYLWEIMTKKNISLDRINKQKESLLSIYSKFFENLAKVDFSWKIVICFPFWELNGKFIYFNEILEILNKFCVIENIFKNSEINLSSKSGSLLYKREKQLVWREIFKLKIKKI